MTDAGHCGNAADAPGRRPAGAGHAPLIRNLRRDTDPLFRRVGLDLDEG